MAAAQRIRPGSTLPEPLIALLDAQREYLSGIEDAVAARLLRETLRARADLIRRIQALELTGKSTFTLFQQRAILVQVEHAIRQMQDRMRRTMADSASHAHALAVRDVERQVALAAKEFRGAEPGVPWPEATRLASEVSKLRPIEADRVQAGTAKYGEAMVAEVEQSLSRSLLKNETTYEATRAVLGKNEWLTQVYRAERLARTEFSYAYNGEKSAQLGSIARQDDDLWLMWHEHCDGPVWAGPKNLPWLGPAKPLDDRVDGGHGRVGDSQRMHGQLRRPGEPFVDPGTGQTYDHPPSRPNGRETVVLVRVDPKTGRLAY